MIIYTVGHSARSLREFVLLLRAHRVGQVADVRTVPRSRRHPHFSSESLALALAKHDVRYQHFPELGGFRRPRRDSPNTGWHHDSFRGYADHMQTREFEEGIARLLEFASGAVRRGSEAEPVPGTDSCRAPRTAVMCAEALSSKCHRALLSDALVVRGMTVRHIVSAGPAQPHHLCDFARTEGTTITYNGDTGLPFSESGNQKARNRSK